jgi:hypothetical protein
MTALRRRMLENLQIRKYSPLGGREQVLKYLARYTHRILGLAPFDRIIWPI